MGEIELLKDFISVMNDKDLEVRVYDYDSKYVEILVAKNRAPYLTITFNTETEDVLIDSSFPSSVNKPSLRSFLLQVAHSFVLKFSEIEKPDPNNFFLLTIRGEF